MQKIALKILSGFLAMVALSLSVLPFQVVGTEYVSKESFWNWVASSGDIAQGILSHIPIGSRDNVCAKSDDGYHHSNGFIEDGQDGYFLCVCKDCGQTFRGYASDIPSAYDSYVATLPASGYTSTGGLLWQPTWVNVSGLYPGSYSTNFLELYTFDPSGSTLSLAYRPNSFPSGFLVTVTSFPHYGAYRVYVPFTVSYQYQGTKGTIVSKQLFSAVSSQTTRLTPSSSYDISISTSNKYPDWASQTYTSFNFVLPIFEVIPDTVVDKNIYNINTRPTSITGGNYGIVGDNGQITKVEDNSTIVNETNNTYYNPATGQTVPITGWSYDYSDRSYKVTLESGDTVTVTYGDENITIQEGDTIYNVYYLIDGTGSENPPCEHDWQKGEATVPTCTIPGKASYVCSKCQQTKSETIPALGHNWQVKQTVTTQYDEEGNLTQQGYTIFECSRCHEQYKSTDGTIPPGGGSGTDPGGDEGETIWDKLGNLVGSVLGGLIGLIDAALGKVLDALIALAEKMMEKLKVVVEAVLSIFDELPALFNGFLDFLVALFPFLPAELMAILTFGVIAIVFIGIIKAVRR